MMMMMMMVMILVMVMVIRMNIISLNMIMQLMRMMVMVDKSQDVNDIDDILSPQYGCLQCENLSCTCDIGLLVSRRDKNGK